MKHYVAFLSCAWLLWTMSALNNEPFGRERWRMREAFETKAECVAVRNELQAHHEMQALRAKSADIFWVRCLPSGTHPWDTGL